MEVTTTQRGPKPFAWSYSKLKNFETCPKRHWEIDLQKKFKEDSEQLKWGNLVHSALAARLEKGTQLPAEMIQYEFWAERILKGAEGGQLLVEQKLAITKDFTACEWFSPQAWFRAVCDVIVLHGPVALGADWKTGKIVEDSHQLALVAACIFAHHQNVQKVRSEFIWLKEGDASSRADFDRARMPEIWKQLWPRIEALENAHNTTSYPAKPGRLCRSWCPVTNCPHHGGE